MEPINSLLRDSLFIDINDALDRIAQPMGAPADYSHGMPS